MLGHCFDKRVLGGLAAVAVGVLIVAPQVIWAALPLLLIAACPLSMLLMGRTMMGRSRQAADYPVAAANFPVPSIVRDGSRAPADSDAQTTLLRRQLRQIEEQQAALAQQLAEIEAARALAAEPAPRNLDPIAAR